MKKLYIIILIIILITTLFLIYNKMTNMDVIVKFDDLEPFEKQMSVYYKGFKIGKTTKIYPDKDYQNTYLRLKLKGNKINFPNNIFVRIKKKNMGGYVSIIYPDSPSLTKLKNEDVIRGEITKDLSAYLEDKFTGEDIEHVVQGATGLIDSANKAVNSLNQIFIDVDEIIKDSKKDIKTATTNLAKTTKNLKEMSSSLSDTAQSSEVSNSIKNIEEITSNLGEITNQLETSTVPVINAAVCETYGITKNVNEITSGVKNTLKKHFGFGRFIFGRPISKDCD